MPSAASRFKISKPTLQSPPVERDSLPSFDYLGGGSHMDGPFPSMGGSSQWQSAPSSSRSNGNGAPYQSQQSRPNQSHQSRPSQSHQSRPSQSSPTRPARSRARGQPSIDIPPVRATAPEQYDDDRIPSPSSPTTPEFSIPPASDNAHDPWASDRTQRSQARQQTGDSAKIASLRPPVTGDGSDRLRNLAAQAFMSGTKPKREPSVKRPPRPKRTQPVEQWDDRVGATGGRFAEVDSVMRTIKREWSFIMEGDFSPASLALSLLSSQQSGALPEHPDLREFLTVHSKLSSSLQTAVQAHFQTFAASLPTHSNFVQTLERAQAQVKTSREALKEAREGISDKGKAELASVRARERQVREMLQILDVVDELKQVPEQLESFIADKRFLQAALLLQRSIKKANREVLLDVGALADLRQHFASQENTLTDILVEELHNHLYLKAFNSESRWKPYVPGQQSLPVIEPEITTVAPRLSTHEPSEQTTSRFSQYITSLSIKPNHEPLLDEVPEQHPRASRSSMQMKHSASISSLASVGGLDNGAPELDSFAYVETLLESLAAMGRLGSALDTVVQRVPVEIHQLIDTTTDEVAERAEHRNEELAAMARPQSLLLAEKRDLESMPLFDNHTLRVVVDLDATGPPKHAVILRDLFWTLYSKLAAVMEGHRAMYEVVRWIASRRDFRDTRTDLAMNAPVLEIWKPVQQEIRQLLQTYLEDDSQGSALSHSAIPSINDVLREGRLTRDKQRELFKFRDSDTRKVNNEIKDVDEGLKQTLRMSVPGLINLQQGENVLNTHSASDERFSSSGRHRTLIPANPFNVTVLFQPTLSLIERTTAIVPQGFEEEMSQFGTVLDEFVQEVFLPQLDEKVTASFQQAVSGYDAFQLDRRPSLGQEKPPLKSSVRVMALIQGLCAMLQETPFHRENYSRLIVGVVAQYYQQCSTRFKDLVTLSTQSDGSQIFALPAAWSQRDDVSQALLQVRTVASQDHKETEVVGMKEVQLEMSLLGDKPPPESELIHSARKLESLGNLAHSIRWFMDTLLDLQQLADDGDIEKAQITREPGEPPRLPLTRAMAQRFEAIVQTYEQLVAMTLNTMHLEVRCRVLCNLSSSLLRADFRLESEAMEPDPDVVDLNSTLMDMDRVASKTLSDADHDFMFRGLALLINHIFVHAARQIKNVNGAGARKLRRNILSLQQTLRGIIPSSIEGMLAHATEYWDLFERGPKETLRSIGALRPKFSFDDYQAMLKLQCVPGENGDGVFNSYLIELHGAFEKWERV